MKNFKESEIIAAFKGSKDDAEMASMLEVTVSFVRSLRKKLNLARRVNKYEIIMDISGDGKPIQEDISENDSKEEESAINGSSTTTQTWEL